MAYVLDLAKMKTEDSDYIIYNSDLISKIDRKKKSEVSQVTIQQEGLCSSTPVKKATQDESETWQNTGYQLLEKIEDAQEKGDLEALETAEENFKKYKTFISNKYGIMCRISKNGKKLFFKTFPRLDENGEKIRQRIKNQTKNAIKDISERMPLFSRHLKNSLKTKLLKTIYHPESPLDWHVSIK